MVILCHHVVYKGKVGNIFHKNIISLFILLLRNRGEISCVKRESDRQGTAGIRYLQRALLLCLALGRLKIFNHLCFSFVLGSYLLSTLVSLVHLDFTFHPGAVWPPRSTPWLAWHLVSPLLYFLFCVHCIRGEKLLSLYIFLEALSHFPASHLCNSRGFSAFFVYLRTHLHILFLKSTY